MANFTGAAQANAVAAPPVNSPPSTQAGRVRVFYDSYTSVAADDVANLDTITFGAEVIPLGARILSCDMTWEAMGGTSVIGAVTCGGTTLIATTGDMNGALTDAMDTKFVAVTTSAGYPILTFSTFTADWTDAKTIQILITYVID